MILGFERDEILEAMETDYADNIQARKRKRFCY